MYSYDINTKKAYTEYRVESPTRDFALGFEFDETKNNLHAKLDGISLLELGYNFELINNLTVRVTPAIEYGVFRLERETDIDENHYKFTAGAVFEARTIDSNFEQIRNSQQELRDEVKYTATRLQVKDTILEIVASTSYPEPEGVFGTYVTARKFELDNFFPHVAVCVSEEPIVVGIYKNSTRIGQIDVSNEDSTYSTVTLDTEQVVFERGERLVLKLDTFHYTLTQVAVTLIGRFPLYDLV